MFVREVEYKCERVMCWGRKFEDLFVVWFKCLCIVVLNVSKV